MAWSTSHQVTYVLSVRRGSTNTHGRTTCKGWARLFLPLRALEANSDGLGMFVCTIRTKTLTTQNFVGYLLKGARAAIEAGDGAWGLDDFLFVTFALLHTI